MQRTRSIDFHGIALAALSNSDAICRRWLPDGKRQGHEWVATSPIRADRRPGSFKVNLSNGRWGDFATGDRGGDLIALAAHLFNIPQKEAAIRMAEMLNMDPFQ